MGVGWGICIDCSQEDNNFLKQLREKEQRTDTGSRDELPWKRVIATRVISNHKQKLQGMSLEKQAVTRATNSKKLGRRYHR